MSRPRLLRVAVVGLIVLSCRADPDTEANPAEVCRALSDRGELEEAARCYDDALAVLQASTASREHGSSEQIRMLNRLGVVRQKLGETARAREAFDAALRTARQTSDTSGEANALNSLGWLEKRRGEHHAAIAFYRQALDLWRAMGRRQSEAVTLHNLGVAYSELGHHKEASDFLSESLEIRTALSGKAPASSWTALGWNHHLAGEPAQARQALETAVALSREAGERSREASALDRLGTVLRTQGELTPASERYHAALSIWTDLGSRIDAAATRANLGALLTEQGQPAKAMEELETASAIFRDMEARDGLSAILVELARAERRLGKPEAARARLEQALDIVEELRLAARRRGRRVHPVALWQDYYDLYVDLLMELHAAGLDADAPARAFEESDLTRARNLFEMLVESQVDLRAGIDETLLRRERDVQERLEATEARRQRLAESAPEALEDLDRALRELRLEYQDVEAKIRVRHPDFSQIRDPRPVGLGEIQALLDPGTRLLSYVVGATRSFVFDVSATGIRGYELAGRDKLEALATAAYQSLRSSAERRGRGQVAPALADLGEALLPPLREDPEATRLLVIGEEMLLYVPFAVLPAPGFEAPGCDGTCQLIDRYEVVHVPSASSLLALRQRAATRERPPLRIAVLADPVFSIDDSRVPDPRSASRATEGLPLHRLVHSRREAKSILSHVAPEQSLAALDFEATAQLATSGVLERYQILHFATHAVIDEEHPELSGLVLSRVDASGAPRDDGYLRLHEIYGLRLPADLVVLSACRTALGERRWGEGLVGLTRGFFYAGASRLVVSLWDVDDEATAELMSRFYSGLFEDGLAPAEALRRAQLEMRGEPRWQAPFYWAGFVVQGEWR